MILIQVSNKKQNQQFEHAGGPLEFGRGPRRTAERYVLNDIFVSRDQLRIEELPGERLHLKNLSLKMEAQIEGSDPLLPGSAYECDLPVRLTLGVTHIDIEWLPGDAFDESSLQTIEAAVTPAGDPVPVSLLGEEGELPTPEELGRWLETVIAVQRTATDSTEFYERTARVMVEFVGLDLGMVLLRREWNWQMAARHSTDPGCAAQFSQSLLSHVVAERRTVYQDLTTWTPPTLTLQGTDAVVVAPVFGPNEDVVGALYGLRNARFPARGGRIAPLEAQMVQLLASTVGGQLTRAKATRVRVVQEQFFSPKVMRELDRDPTLLEGRAHEVTLLVSGLHGFTELADKLGPEHACRLVREVLERHSERVADNGGVIVEYRGAGLTALWNAPARQQDHALLASGAAMAMLGELNELGVRWQELAGGPLRFGIGLHTGSVHAGSMGSSFQFKYAAYGPAVELARSVQEATLRLGIPLLVTTPTREELPETLALRRLGAFRLSNGSEAVSLHEVHGVTAAPEWVVNRDSYESALSLYEEGKWADAQQVLQALADPAAPGDAPTRTLMRHIWECLETTPAPFDPAIPV